MGWLVYAMDATNKRLLNKYTVFTVSLDTQRLLPGDVQGKR